MDQVHHLQMGQAKGKPGHRMVRLVLAAMEKVERKEPRIPEKERTGKEVRKEKAGMGVEIEKKGNPQVGVEMQQEKVEEVVLEAKDQAIAPY